MILIFILGLVALRILYSVGEVYYERDWPRDTWKGLLIALGLLCIAISAFGQAVRIDIPLQTSGPSVPISGGPLPQALWVANAAAYLCTHPSTTLAACQAAPITTYTDSTEGTTCPTATPLVQLPGNTCTASTGTAANVGFWYGGGVFDYWIVSSYGTYGPFSGNSSNSALPSSCGNPIGIPCGGTGATTAAGANLNITGVTQTGTLGTSSQVSTFPGTVAAGTATPTTIGSNGVLLNGVPALQSQTSLYNYYSGGAGNLTGTGIQNAANGFQALFSNTTGNFNNANGLQALFFNTIGNDNTANGYQAGQYIADGVTANRTSSNSVYEGFHAYPLADGDTNENVIGNTAIGHGSNTTTLGNTSITDTYIVGIVHGTSFTGNAATATTAAALSVPLAHAIIFPDPNAGAVYTASQVLGTFYAPNAGTVPASGTGTYNGVASTSVCKLTTAAAASTTFTFADNGTSFGTVVFAASGTTGTFTISSAKSVSSGDKITLTAPATADTTAAGLNCSLVFAY